MWFITQRAVELWSSLLQDVVDARNAQGLIKELGKFLKKKNPSGLIKANNTASERLHMTLQSTEVSGGNTVYPFPVFLLFSMHLVTVKDRLIQQFFSIFSLFYCFQFNFPPIFWYS